MWKWSCSKDPKLIHEHHSAKDAYESIVCHVHIGYAPLGVLPCSFTVHTLVDDGVPCDQERFTGEPCTIPYIRDVD